MSDEQRCPHGLEREECPACALDYHQRIDWGLIFGLALVTLFGFLAGANAALKSNLSKVKLLEQDLKACERSMTTFWVSPKADVVESCFTMGRTYGCWRPEAQPTWYPPDSGVRYFVDPRLTDRPERLDEDAGSTAEQLKELLYLMPHREVNL